MPVAPVGHELTGDRAGRRVLVSRTAAATPVGLPARAGVQPGGIVVSDVAVCTLNFLFHDGRGVRYIGTAGHCILPDHGGDRQVVWPPGTGPVARDGSDRRIGEFAFAVHDHPQDFALVRLDPGVPARPELAHFGGPTGVNVDQHGDVVVLQYYGEASDTGALLPARSGLAVGLPEAGYVKAIGAATGGDSGSGVISADGRAVGVLVASEPRGITIGPNGVDGGTIEISRLLPQMHRAQEALGVHLSLQTAALR